MDTKTLDELIRSKAKAAFTKELEAAISPFQRLINEGFNNYQNSGPLDGMNDKLDEIKKAVMLVVSEIREQQAVKDFLTKSEELANAVQELKDVREET